MKGNKKRPSGRSLPGEAEKYRGSTLVCHSWPPVTQRMRGALPPMLPDARSPLPPQGASTARAPLCPGKAGYSFRSSQVPIYRLVYGIRGAFVNFPAQKDGAPLPTGEAGFIVEIEKEVFPHGCAGRMSTHSPKPPSDEGGVMALRAMTEGEISINFRFQKRNDWILSPSRLRRQPPRQRGPKANAVTAQLRANRKHPLKAPFAQRGGGRAKRGRGDSCKGNRNPPVMALP